MGGPLKLLWLEDFLVLIDAGTFSKAAALRNVTQPAFSRRIQMLEAWLGVDLVDRRGQPMRLTATAARFEPEIRALVSRAHELKSAMGLESKARQRIVLTTQHNLTISHLPQLLGFLQARRTSTVFSIRSGNREQCVAQLARGEADILLCCEAPGVLLPTPGPDSERLDIGQERLIPVTARDEAGRSRHQPRAGDPLRLLNYPQDSFLGRVVWTHCLPSLLTRHGIETVCESAFTAGIKEMALFGLGIAWLPQGLIERELRAGTLISLEDQLVSAQLTLVLQRLHHNPAPAVDDIWRLLERESPPFQTPDVA